MADLDNEQNERIRARIRTWIAETNKSQAELARLIRRAAPSLNISMGRGGFSHETAERLAAVFGMDVRDLVGPKSALPSEGGASTDERPAPDPFRVAADAAVLDGAEQQDIDAAAKLDVASAPSLSWQRAYNLIFEVRTKRFVDPASKLGKTKGPALPTPPAPIKIGRRRAVVDNAKRQQAATATAIEKAKKSAAAAPPPAEAPRPKRLRG